MILLMLAYFLWIKKQEIPKISAIFEIFEPMIVPIGISPASLNMLEIPMNISGADVPNAINVRPMSKSLIPNLLARLDE